MGKLPRNSFKNRANRLGSRVNSGIQEGVNEQLTLQPDQVLPVVQKVNS